MLYIGRKGRDGGIMTNRRQDTRREKGGFFVGAALLSVMLAACGSPLSRPTPSRDAFIAQYLAYFDSTQIEKLDFAYKGAIGGAVMVGRVQFKGPIRINDAMVNARVQAGNVTVGTFAPAKMAEEDKQDLIRQLKSPADGRMPSWLDLPFDRNMRMIRDAGEGDTRNAQPRYEKTWLIDDEHNVVYVYGNWG
jgi:hypothetical protein